MKRNTALALGITAGVALVATELARGRRLHVCLEMERETSLSPEAVIGEVSHVEREPGMIPFVRRVKVLETGMDWVRYRVDGSTYGFSWWVQYRKVWDYEKSIVKWSSERGSYGIQNSGRLMIIPGADKNIIRLETGYSVHAAAIGRVLESAMRPVLTYAFVEWMDALAGGNV